MVSQAIAHHYKYYRDHGYTADDAYASAKRSIAFRADLKATVAAHKKRSQAAKKAWKARKAREA